MKNFTFEVTKTIVVTVEAADYPSAVKDIKSATWNGEHDKEWHCAELLFDLLDAEEQL